MPQPIRKQCHVEISGLIHRPQHATVLGQIIGVSGRLESELGWILAFCSRGSATIAIPMFHAVTSTDAQRAMLQAAAQGALSGSELNLFNDLMDDFRSRYGERSRLVHNLWGHSDDHPDKAIWCRAADAASMMADVAAAPRLDRLPVLGELSVKCMTYSVQDLIDVYQRLNDYTVRVGNFVVGLMLAHPALTEATNAPPNGEPVPQ